GATAFLSLALRPAAVVPQALLALVAVSAGAPLAFERATWTLVWAGELVLVATVARFLPTSTMVRTALATAVAVGVQVLLVGPSMPEGMTRAAAFAGAAVALAASYVLVPRLAARAEKTLAVPAFLIGGAAVVATVGLALELSSFRITVAWAFLGLLLVVAGIAARHEEPRWAGILVLAAALGKAFVVDVSGLSVPLRVLAFLTLGGVLVAASFLYTRVKDRLFVED
ncbi:MAG: DUF2339 domain-containing protein, partial [Methanobacteriota archaeon]